MHSVPKKGCQAQRPLAVHSRLTQAVNTLRRQTPVSASISAVPRGSADAVTLTRAFAHTVQRNRIHGLQWDLLPNHGWQSAVHLRIPDGRVGPPHLL